MVEDHPLFRKKALEKLQSPEQLNQLMIVVPPQGWLGLIALLVVLGVVIAWGFLGTVEVKAPGTGILVLSENDNGSPDAILFLTILDSRRVEPGMEARVSPITARREEYGYLLGTVSTIQGSPSTFTEILAVTNNDALAQSFVASGEIIRVEIDFNLASDSVTGFEWTVAQGPSQPLQAGVFSTGYVVVSQQKPIELAFSNLIQIFVE